MASTTHFVRITRTGYSRGNVRYPEGTVFRVNNHQLEAMTKNREPAWGKEISESEAKKASVIDISTPKVARAAAAEPASAEAGK